MTTQSEAFKKLHALKHGVELFWFLGLGLLQTQVRERSSNNGKPLFLRIVLLSHSTLLRKYLRHINSTFHDIIIRLN